MEQNPLKANYIYIWLFTTEGLFEVATESWPEWDLNQRPHTHTHTHTHTHIYIYILWYSPPTTTEFRSDAQTNRVIRP